MRSTLLVFLILSALSSNAFAYLDPGSSSAILSALIAIITIGIFAAKNFFYEKIVFWGKKKNSHDSTKNFNIVFYSEGKQYWNVFFPILKELDNRGVSASYLTSDENDPGFSEEFNHIACEFIGNDYTAYYLLNKIKANLVVMTTPGLEVLQIKKSKHVKHYAFITHSAGNCARYKAHGIDYYDSIMVAGTSDKNNIIELEGKRKTPKKQIEIVGCTYLDVLREKLHNNNYNYHMFDKQQKTILLSPTWGEHGLLSKYGSQILNKLTSIEDTNIIIRPHPQSFTSDKEVIGKLTKEFPETPTLKWDNEADGLIAMYHADIMISDFSGIVYDYLFLFQRPILTFKSQFEKRGRDAMDLDEELTEMTYLNDIGQTLEECDIPNLETIIENNLARDSDLQETIKDAKNELAQFPGESGKNAANFIQNIMKKIQE